MQIELLVAFTLLAMLAFPLALDRLRHELRRQRVCAAARDFGGLITRSFLTVPCSQCDERDMGLVSVGPNARSIHYECRGCRNRHHASAASTDFSAAAPQYELFQNLLSAFNERYRRRRIAIDIVFRTPRARATDA